MKTSSRGWAHRAALGAGGVFAAVVLLEAGLRLASLFYGPREARDHDGMEPHLVLCLGDSHTYGHPCPAEQSYPGRLQAELDRRSPAGYRVLNLGLPGMNSSQVRALLPRWLDRYGPQTVVVCVGSNNTWNTSETDGRRTTPGISRWVAGLRMHRLALLLLDRLGSAGTVRHHPSGRPEFQRILLDGGRAGVEHRDPHSGKVLIRHSGDPKGPSLGFEKAAEILRIDLERIFRLCARRHVTLVLLTYAAFSMPEYPETRHLVRNEAVSDTMLAFGRANQISVVDVRDRFSRLLADGTPREVYFSSRRGAHPNARGYAEIAAAVADLLEPPGTERPPAATR